MTEAALCCTVDVKSNNFKVEHPFHSLYALHLIFDQDLILYTTNDGLFKVENPEEGNSLSSNVFQTSQPLAGIGRSDASIFVLTAGDLLEAAISAELKFQRVLSDHRVAQVACGREHVLALTVGGRVLARGKGPQTGLGFHREKSSVQFHEIAEIKEVQGISAGDYHSAAVVHERGSSETAPHLERQRQLLGRQASRGRNDHRADTHNLLQDIRNLPTPISEKFVKGFVDMGRTSSQLLDQESSLDVSEVETQPDETEGIRADTLVYVWGRGDSYCLGLNDTVDQPKPQPVPSLTGILKVVCGAEHTVVLNAQFQVLVWGHYHPENTERKPAGVALTAAVMPPFVVDVSAGRQVTMVTAYSRTRPEIHMVDKNRCLQGRTWITAKSSTSQRHLQTMACKRQGCQGVAIVLMEPANAGQPQSALSAARDDLHLLCYNLCLNGRHLFRLRTAFTRRWEVSAEQLEAESNIVKTFSELVDGLSVLYDAIHQLWEYLTDKICRLPVEAVGDKKMLDLITNCHKAYEEIFLLFKDISAFNGFFAVVRKYKAQMQAVLAEMKIENKKREKDIADALLQLFEKALFNFSYLTDLNKLKTSRPMLEGMLENMMERHNVLLKTLQDVTDSAEIVKNDLTAQFQDLFFARDRRIRIISTRVPVVFSAQCEPFARSRDYKVIVTGTEFIIIYGDEIFVWDLRSVWLKVDKADRKSLRLIFPEFSCKLTCQRESDQEKWVKELCAGIFRQCKVTLDESNLEALSNRTFSYTFLFGRCKNCFYEGQWKDGVMHGRGLYTSDDKKIIYDGNFENHKRCGFGKMVMFHSDGVTEVQLGCWQDDHLDGYAAVERFRMQRKRDGGGESKEQLVHFTGYYSQGKRQGMGKLIQYCDGCKVEYLGNWAKNMRNGFGIERDECTAFFGHWVDEQKHGPGVEFDYLTGDIAEKMWSASVAGGTGTIHGHNYVFNGDLVNNRPHGRGVVWYSLPGYSVEVQGHLQLHDGNVWLINNGQLRIEPKESGSAKDAHDTEPQVGRKWRSLVDQCGNMLLPASIRRGQDVRQATERLWRELMPLKLKLLHPDCKTIGHDHNSYFAEFALRDEVTRTDWNYIVRFCQHFMKDFETFPLTYFIDSRMEVFSFFLGVNNGERLVELVVEELNEFRKDTYELLRVLFPALPQSIDEVIELHDPEERVKGHDLVYEILSENFYIQLVTIFNASSADNLRNFHETVKRFQDDATFLEQAAGFPSGKDTRTIIDAIKKDISEYPGGSEEKTHVMDIIKMVKETFSEKLILNAKEAFKKLNNLKEVHELLARFISGFVKNPGADHIVPTYLFILWKAQPKNLGLHLKLIEILTDHREGYHEISGFALVTVDLAYKSLSKK